MLSRNNGVFKIAIGILCFVCVFLTFSRPYDCGVYFESEKLSPPEVYLELRESEMEEGDKMLARSLKESRDSLSKQLNQLRKTMGQRDCERVKQFGSRRDADNRRLFRIQTVCTLDHDVTLGARSQGKTSSSGGWCRNTSTENSGDHMTDTLLVTALSKFLTGKRVGSFGDGPGAYKREVLKKGKVSVYDAYDGAPFCEETSEGRVSFMDLTIPQYGLPIYDWVLSLEVAEHIPTKFERVYLDNLVRHSKEGIILSWAVPSQEGLSHINNKPPEYVTGLMNKVGFEFDEESSKLLQSSSKFKWFRTNLFVYKRKDNSHVDVLARWYS